MVKTMTVEDLMSQLSVYPPNMPIFFYDIDKERDSCLEVLELAGPYLDPDDDCSIRPTSPYYCKGVCNVEDYWQENGTTIFLCLREKTFRERKESMVCPTVDM